MDCCCEQLRLAIFAILTIAVPLTPLRKNLKPSRSKCRYLQGVAMRYFASVIGFLLLLSGIVDAQYHAGAPYEGTFHTGFPGEPVHGYFQPVLVRTPEGTSLAAVINGQFSERLPTPLQAGLLIGYDYRLRITGIPFNPGRELFPTITLLARTYPPPGRELDFPIVINLTFEDLELALAGRYITRVVYLENPNTALPVPTDGKEQISHDTHGSADPVAIAKSLGLPVAIVRIGGRVPPQNTLNGMLTPEFALGSPPWVLNRTIPPENAVSISTTGIPRDSLTIDPALKEAGASVIERRQQQQQLAVRTHSWRPPHQPPTAPGGRASEYLVNGDDTGKPVFVEDWTVHNLSAGNTVAHFDTLGGQIVVEPSNRIHIYAPRFAAIRKIEGLLQEGQITALVNKQSQQTLGLSRTASQPTLTEQEARTQYSRTRDQLHGIEGQRRGAGVENTQNLIGYSNFQIVDSDSIFLLQRTFGLEGTAQAQLARGAANARAWMGSEGLTVQINELAPMSATGIEGAAAYFQIEDEQSRSSKLRLIKVASKDAASPGEIVEFTLRFDNIGNQLIGNVTILEDLTGRLEFLPGTAVASLKSGFVPQPNSSGGFTLRFEIIDPLAPGGFGVIKFQCQVR